MSNILKSLQMAFASLLRIRMLLLILLPPFVSILALLSLFVFFWNDWSVELARLFSGLWGFQWFQALTGFVDLGLWMAFVFLVLLFVPLSYALAIFVVSVLVMPVVLKWVGDADFKHLEKKRGGSLLGSVVNTLWAMAVFLGGFIVTLPLWLIPGFQVLIPLLLTAWLNKKVFLYDVLQDFASEEERRRIESEERGPLYGMGFLLGLFSYVPLAFLLVPLITALSYTYYGLNALEARRK